MGEIRRRKTGKNYGSCEIAEVRSGRKDRHSKVCTAKGPRDRRVRLAAHTAIQFYDVQDRLGYDRPSKAVDWLIKKAKSAIDELAELPAWNPYTYTNQKTQTRAMHKHVDKNTETPFRNMEKHFLSQNLQRKEEEDNQNCYGSLSFLPLGASAMAVTPTSPVPFQSYPGDFLTGNGQQSEDLQLSLQSLHGHENDHVLFSEAAPTIGGFDKWSEQHNHPAHELNQFQRTYPWNSTETYTGYGNEFFFSPSPPPTNLPSPVTLQPFSGESQFFLQRGPIQSTKTPFLGAFPADPIPSSDDNPIPPYLLHQPLVPSLGFSSDGISDEQFSASFDSRH